jgi:FAD/FMN-containing dehydrogenase
MERFEQVVGLLKLAQNHLRGTLTSYEVMWNDFYRLTTTPPALSKAPLRSDYALYVLLETLGSEHAGEQARLEQLLEQAYSRSLFQEAVVAGSSSQREALWRIRADSEQIEAQYSPTFSFDVSLPIAHMENYVQGVRTDLEQAFGEVHCWVFGHAADGNLHLGVWGKDITLADRVTVELIIYQPLLPLGGSVSAEHGIGLEKKAYLSLSRTAEEISVMRRLKSALDPNGIMNPGKVFDLA